MGIMDLFKKKSSGNVAKDRLKLVLVSDRANCSSEMMEMMKRDVIEVISRYMDLVVHCISHNFTSFTSNRLLSFLVQSMCLTESTILFGFHSVRMSLLILGHVIVTLLAFCTCQCDLCAHDFHLHLNFRCCYSAILLLSGSHALRCRKT